MNTREFKDKSSAIFSSGHKLEAQVFKDYTQALTSIDMLKDTGWVNINTSNVAINGTTVRARRIGNTVIIDCSGAIYDTIALSESGWWEQRDSSGNPYSITFLVPVNGIPKGFRSSKTIMGSVYNDGPDFIGTWQLSSVADNYIAVKIRNKKPGKLTGIRLSQIKYFTDEPFPDEYLK